MAAPRPAAERRSGARARLLETVTPRRLLRVASMTEAATWALLLLGMWLEHGPAQLGLGVAIAGSLHGAVFLA